jgi:hypothetical protein
MRWFFIRIFSVIIWRPEAALASECLCRIQGGGYVFVGHPNFHCKKHRHLFAQGSSALHLRCASDFVCRPFWLPAPFYPFSQARQSPVIRVFDVSIATHLHGGTIGAKIGHPASSLSHPRNGECGIECGQGDVEPRPP